jgi:GNAT superfamily N-acetyltransferase
MTDFIIREASIVDIDSLCRLYYEFHEFHVRGAPDRLLSLGPLAEFDRSELALGLQKILDDEKATLFVAEVAGERVGFAEVYARQDEANPMRVEYQYGHLQSLMVLEGFRGQGIGTALVKAAEQWAKVRGVNEMRLDTWEFPGDPVSFYRRVGYRTLRREMIHRF